MDMHIGGNAQINFGGHGEDSRLKNFDFQVLVLQVATSIKSE